MLKVAYFLQNYFCLPRVESLFLFVSGLARDYSLAMVGTGTYRNLSLRLLSLCVTIMTTVEMTGTSLQCLQYLGLVYYFENLLELLRRVISVQPGRSRSIRVISVQRLYAAASWKNLGFRG